MNNKIYPECLCDSNGEVVQVAGLKLAMPTDVSIINMDESVCIKYTDPNNIDLNGSPLAEYAGTIIVRKVGSVPKSRTDGIIVSDSKVRNQYKDNGFIDTGLVNDTEYYYGIFPYTEDGVYNYKYTESIIPGAIYPDPPTNVKAYAGNTTAKIIFSLSEDATKAKISYSTSEPESIDIPYGNIIEVNESPYTLTGLTNDIPYYITVYSSNEKNRCTPYSSIITITPKEAEVYSFTIDDNEPDPNTRVTYGDDNIDYESAYMDYDKDKFNFGSWVNAFFMQFKPCMLKYDGTVDYYLDPNDYTKKEDGTPSDVANTAYDGNAMIEFPKTYIKIVNLGNKKGKVTISNMKLDEDYKCWSHVDSNGNIIDHCYMPIYDGSLIDGKLRSISGRGPARGINDLNRINYAKANNISDDHIWHTQVWCDYQLIVILLILISKSTDCQTKFGNGNVSNVGIKASGTLDNKGLFYGTQDTLSCVKVFGMENVWGNIWTIIDGYFNIKGTVKIKMTYGTSDGSTVEGYNQTGDGYITYKTYTPNIGVDATGYVSSVDFTQFGLIPIEFNASSTTYYCDSAGVIRTTINSHLYLGGSGVCNYNQFCGIFCINTSSGLNAVSEASGHNHLGASVSCKPLAPVT